MTIRYECQDCGASMKIKDKLAGKKGHCPKCKAEFTIPGSSAEEEEYLSLDGEEEFIPDIPRMPYVEKSTPMPRTTGASRTTDAYAEAFDSTSNTAGDLLKQAAASSKNKNKKGQKLFGLDEREDPDQSRFDAGETFKYVVFNALGPMAGIGVMVMLVYWISSSVIKDNALPKLATVIGSVTLDNQPLPNAQVIFQPIPEDPNEPVRNAGSPSYGQTNAQGKFLLMYLPRVKGAVIGKHRVEIRGQLMTTKDGVAAVVAVNQVTQAEVKPGSNTIDLPLKSEQ